MPLIELEQLVNAVLVIQASRRAPRVLADENDLLKIIGRELLSDNQKTRMCELQKLRDDEQLSSEGYAELAASIEHSDAMHAERLAALAKLADLRGVTLPEAMTQIGLNLPDYE